MVVIVVVVVDDDNVVVVTDAEGVDDTDDVVAVEGT